MSSSSGAADQATPIEVVRPGTGAQIGEYRIVRSLGSGGMGQVYAAQRHGQSELVALKQVSVVDPTLLVRFKQEFRSLADLPHPNLVRLGELVVLPAEALAFFTMELIDGQPLTRWVRRSAPAGTTPNIPRLCHALRQLCAGVSHLHRAARVHRDLKPSNVLVTAEGRVAILDFGLVYEITDDNARITATGQFVGTPAYMAPEQATRSCVGPAIDLYAIGVTLFECLTGCMPFVGSASAILIDKQHELAPDPRELAAGIPNWLAQLCRVLLDIEPGVRPSADELIGLIDANIEAAPLSVVVGSRGPRLFGRELELAALRRAHMTVARAGATVVRLTGPRGRGKSALVAEFLQSLRESDAVILRGRCHPRESVPYKGVDTVVDALASYLRGLPPVEAAALRPRHVRELCELFPVLQGIWSESRRLVIEHEPVVRRRLGVEALGDVLGRIGDSRALLVFVDDAHWGDLDGLDVLSELLQPSSPAAMLLILAYDARGACAEPATSSAVIELLDELGTPQGARTIDLALAPLDEHDARSLARSLIEPWTAEDQEAAIRQLAHDSAGEPLALVSAARSNTAHDGSVAADGDLLRRVRSLDVETRALLELATVAGAPLPNALVREVLDTDVASFEVAACELVMTGMLGVVALESRGVIRLARPRVGELVRVELDGERVTRLHLRLAETLATRGADSERIAEHFERGGDRTRARLHTTEAAHRAAEALAFARAERLYRRALELLPPGREAEHKTERRQIQIALADQLVHLARSPEAAKLHAEAGEPDAREQASQLRLQAARQYAVADWSNDTLPRLREQMRSADEALPGSRLSTLALTAYNRLRLLTHGRRALLREPDEVSPELLARFDLVHSTTLALSRREILVAEALHPRVMELARTTGDPLRLVVALYGDAVLSVTLGRFDAATASIAEARELAELSDDPLIHAHVDAAAHFHQTRSMAVDAAEASFRAAMLRLERCSGETWLEAQLLCCQARLLRSIGAYDRFEMDWIARLRASGQRLHETSMILERAIMHAQLGTVELGRRNLALARAVWQVELYCVVDHQLGLAEVWLLLAEGRTAKALELARATEVELHQQGLARLELPRVEVRDSCLRAQLCHAVATGDPDAAPRRRALRRQRRCGSPAMAICALLLSAGRASLCDEADVERSAWRKALVECEARSSSGLAAAVQWRLAELGGEDTEALLSRAHGYFRVQGIEDIEHFVGLMAPARRDREHEVVAQATASE